MPLMCSYTVVSQLSFLPQTLEKKSVCMWGMMLGEQRERQVLVKHHLTLALFQSSLPDAHFHIPPPQSFLDFFFLSSPLCPRVISLMMCNALKVFHQPDLLKWSIGNALGHFSSHPLSLSLSLHHYFSLAPHFLLPSFLWSIHCPDPPSFPSTFLSCLTQLSCCSLSIFPHFCSFSLSGV